MIQLSISALQITLQASAVTQQLLILPINLKIWTGISRDSCFLPHVVTTRVSQLALKIFFQEGSLTQLTNQWSARAVGWRPHFSTV